jgi:hypothetical protein
VIDREGLTHAAFVQVNSVFVEQKCQSTGIFSQAEKEAYSVRDTFKTLL